MTTNFLRPLLVLANLIFLPFLGNLSFGQANLENELLQVHFEKQGITQIYDKVSGKPINLKEHSFRIRLNGNNIDRAAAQFQSGSAGENIVTYNFASGPYTIQVIYELRPGWQFVSKQLVVSTNGPEQLRIDEVELLRGKLENTVSGEYLHHDGRYGAFLRLSDEDKNQEIPTYGVFWALQNPFMQWQRNGKNVSIKYIAEMDWHKEYGAFKSDRALIGTYKLSGQSWPVQMVPEWRYAGNSQERNRQGPQMDYAEIEAITKCVEAFLQYNPKKSVRVQVGWTLNDFQIDVATQDGREEYKRIIDQAAAVGSQHVLYTPTHTDQTDLDKNRDAWGWENLLWLNMGQKIRSGEWHPNHNPVPADVQALIDYAASKNVGLLAYVFPTMPWMQNPEWTAWVDGQPGGYAGVDTGIRSFQDWFLDLLVSFYKKTEVSGFAFDHWWIMYDQPGTTSKYAQWYGTRRILEELRRRIPNVVIDGRQQYHQTGPWTWLAGSYPHPMASDEQPQSFEAFPDLSWSRISANRTRYANWWFRMNQFTPVQVMPGYMTHQTQRFDVNGLMHRDRFRPRDWDYMGWKYSVLSSVGTAPFNHVINYIPARDIEENEHFSEEDKQWFNHWFDWTDEHIEYMRELRPIISQPMVSGVDGTSAILEDRGFVFLFNPNYRITEATFRLDKSIGLETGERFLLKELYPQEGTNIGHPRHGYWQYGDQIQISMGGTQAMVLEIAPVNGNPAEPVLFNSGGTVELQGDRLVASGVRGAVGHETQLTVVVSDKTEISQLEINGSEVPHRQEGKVVQADVRFEGVRFDKAQQVGKYDSSFKGGDYSATFSVPQRVLDQLEQRRNDWPVSYTEEDLLATWLGPYRLLLYVQISDPNEDMDVAMKINGQPAELKPAYSSVYPQPPGQVNNVTERTFLGYYADLTSMIEANTEYTVTLSLPELEPGQFQGLFFHNIETDYTEELDYHHQMSN